MRDSHAHAARFLTTWVWTNFTGPAAGRKTRRGGRGASARRRRRNSYASLRVGTAKVASMNRSIVPPAWMTNCPMWISSLASSPTNVDETLKCVLPATVSLPRKEMRVKARKYARNEGSRRFKSFPLRHTVCDLRRSRRNSRVCAGSRSREGTGEAATRTCSGRFC